MKCESHYEQFPPTSTFNPSHTSFTAVGCVPYDPKISTVPELSPHPLPTHKHTRWWLKPLSRIGVAALNGRGGRGVGASFSGRSLHSSKFTSSEVATKQGWLPRNTSVGRRVLIYGCAGLPGLPAGRGWPCLMIRWLIHGQSCRTDQAPAGEQARDNSVQAFTSRIITVSGQSREGKRKQRRQIWEANVECVNFKQVCDLRCNVCLPCNVSVVMFVSLAVRVTAKSSQLFQGFAYPQFSSPQDPSTHALWSRVLGLGVGFSLG